MPHQNLMVGANAASDEYIVTVMGITPNVTEVSADVPADGDGVLHHK